jgi:CubicO group peptidase (beta-lactamase class C family)
MKKFLGFIIVSFFFLIHLQSQTSSTRFVNTLATANPESVGVSAERLKHVDNLIQGWIQKGWTNGATAMIIRNGKIVYNKAFGFDDPDKKVPMQTNMIFRIASQTKAVTSVAVMILYEEGKFLLDDPISRYIPEFKEPKVLEKFNATDTTYTTLPAKSEITIRQLLSHTSGISYPVIGTNEARAIYVKNGIPAGFPKDKILVADKMKKLASLPLMHQPGEKWTYGLNTDVLGYLVEIVSGMSLDQFFRKRIFEPLGMNDTFFDVPAEKQNRLVTAYVEDSTGKLQLMKETSYWRGDLVFRDYPISKTGYYSGGAALSSTMHDYAIFLQMLLNGGIYNGNRILSRNTVRMMTMNQIGDVKFGQNKFGLGFRVTTEDGSSLMPTPPGVFEWSGAFATVYWADPKEKLIALCFRQIFLSGRSELNNYFKVMTYQSIVD